MEHAATHGIKCHRDIKPSNILVMQGATPVMSDFGLAAAAEVMWQGKRSLSHRNGMDRFCCSLLVSEGRKVCGTPGFIAPEVYEGKGSDVRSDIYSFGIVLWQMATTSSFSAFHAGEVLYHGNDEDYVQEYQQRVYERQRSGRFSRVKGPLCNVIERCLAYDRSERYSDFGELRTDLEELHQRTTGRSVPAPALPEKTRTFWNNKGISLAELGQYEEAVHCYDRAIKLDPQCAGSWSNKALALRELRRSNEMLRCIDKALAIDPRCVAALTNKANVRRGGGPP